MGGSTRVGEQTFALTGLVGFVDRSRSWRVDASAFWRTLELPSRFVGGLGGSTGYVRASTPHARYRRVARNFEFKCEF